MDDDEFDDYVGTEEVIQDSKQHVEEQISSQVVKETIIQSIGTDKQSINQIGEYKHDETVNIKNEDVSIAVDSKKNEINIYVQSQTIKQQDQGNLQSQYEFPTEQQNQDLASIKYPIAGDAFHIDANKTVIIERETQPQQQTICQKIQSIPVGQFATLSLNQSTNDNLAVHDHLMNEVNSLNYALDDHVSTIDTNQQPLPIQIKNAEQMDEFIQSPNLYIEAISLNPSTIIDQNILIEPFERQAQQIHGVQDESLKFEQQSPKVQEIHHNDPINQQHLIDPIINANQENKQNQDRQANQDQGQQEQDDEFGDFETYQQSVDYIPNSSIIPQQDMQASNAIQSQSGPSHQANSESRGVEQIRIDSNSHRHQNQFLCPQNQVQTQQNQSQVQNIELTQIHPQKPNQSPTTEQFQQSSHVKPQQTPTIQSQTPIVVKGVTLQDQLTAFINSLPNYKRICQRVFYDTG